jgi:hypothetical protein
MNAKYASGEQFAFIHKITRRNYSHTTEANILVGEKECSRPGYSPNEVSYLNADTCVFSNVSTSM